MKFLLDENVDHRLASFLSHLGHDVTSIGDTYSASLLDHEVLAIAQRERRILLTNDRSDFGELIFRYHLPHCGVILFRLKAEEPNLVLKKERLHYVLTEYADRLHQFLVVTPRHVKVCTIVQSKKAA